MQAAAPVDVREAATGRRTTAGRQRSQSCCRASRGASRCREPPRWRRRGAAPLAPADCGRTAWAGAGGTDRDPAKLLRKSVKRAQAAKHHKSAAPRWGAASERRAGGEQGGAATDAAGQRPSARTMVDKTARRIERPVRRRIYPRGRGDRKSKARACDGIKNSADSRDRLKKIHACLTLVHGMVLPMRFKETILLRRLPCPKALSRFAPLSTLPQRI